MNTNRLCYKIIVLSFFLGLTLQGFTQTKKEYDDFHREIYTKLDYPNYQTIRSNCLLNGYVLTLIEIDHKGHATFELLYATNEYFKNVYYEKIRELDTSSLDKCRNYLLPVSYQFFINIPIECKGTINKKYKSAITKNIGHTRIDYTFETFQFTGYF